MPSKVRKSVLLFFQGHKLFLRLANIFCISGRKLLNTTLDYYLIAEIWQGKVLTH